MKNNDIYFQVGENVIHATNDYVAINGAIFPNATMDDYTIRRKGEDELVIKFRGRLL